MIGKRREDGVKSSDLLPGEYGKANSGKWVCRPPENSEGRSVSGVLETHTVIEHEDGTITVSPSILQQYGDGEELYHGFLVRGVWSRA